MDLKIVMVEGPHDGAFISKILQVFGYDVCKIPIGNYKPEYIAQYLKGQYKNVSVEEFNLQSVRQEVLFPSYSLILESEMILIFQMGGDSRADRRNMLVKNICDFLHSPMTADIVAKSGKITFIYEFDADDEGVDARLKAVNDEIKLIDVAFPGLPENASYVTSDGVRWGAYIFAEQDKKGRLENLLLPMMEEDNEELADHVKSFIDRRETYKNIKPTKYPLKARVGVLGQLEKAGCANPAIIEQSSYLTKEKIMTSTYCKALFNFLHG